MDDSNVEQNIQTNLNKANDFEVINEKGEKVKLSDYFGKPIVVNFWASWCGPCKAELPYFMEAYQKYGEDVEFPLYFDTEYSAANTYQVYSIPQTIFIDSEGNLIKSHIGMINKNLLESNILQIGH